MKYLITGATGNLGRRVTEWLVTFTAPENIKAGVHNPAHGKFLDKLSVEKVKIDYQQEDTLRDAFKGIDLIIYIPSKTYKLNDRIAEFENILAATKESKASLIFISFFADQENNPFTMSPFYAYVPRRLAGSGVKYTIVKNTLYADPLVPYLPELIERHHIIYPVGAQPLSFITQNDSAHAIAKLAVEPELRDQGQSYLLSMENNFNMVELSYIMQNITEQDITYQPVTLKEFAHIYAAEGDGSELASMYAGGAMGLLKATSNDFHRITGREPEDMEHFLRNGYQISKLSSFEKEQL